MTHQKLTNCRLSPCASDTPQPRARREPRQLRASPLAMPVRTAPTPRAGCCVQDLAPTRWLPVSKATNQAFGTLLLQVF